jgi:two-component system, sporulation sensor kinase C
MESGRTDVSFSHLRDNGRNAVYFKTVADYTYDWESWHDPRGRVVWINRSVFRLTGYSVEECMAMADYPLPIVVEKDWPRIRQMLEDAIAKRSYNDLEFQIRTRAGKSRWMAVSWQPMYEESGHHLGFRTSVRDVTERQGLKEQLRLYTEHLEQLVQERTARIAQLENNRRQMEKLAAMGELAAGIAHEINNPLAGIRNAFTLIKASMQPRHEHFGLLELVDTEIERVSSIVHQMYQLYKPSPTRASDLVPEKVVRDVICLLDPIARRYDVTLEVLPRPELSTVTLPEGELKQILFNLIRNAIQASSPGQRVLIKVRESSPSPMQDSSQTISLDVIDHGCGIAADVLPHIFEPFFTTKGQQREGMGLGLSVSRNLIESFGGKIHVESQPGIGSTFTVMLPADISVLPRDNAVIGTSPMPPKQPESLRSSSRE